MSKEDMKAYESSYNEKLYPGSTSNPRNMMSVLTSENPSETIKAKIVTDPKSVCVDVTSECLAPWIDPTLPIDSKPLCIANFGKTTAKNDLCEQEGGETILFTYEDHGLLGISMATELKSSEGKKNVGLTILLPL